MLTLRLHTGNKSCDLICRLIIIQTFSRWELFWHNWSPGAAGLLVFLLKASLIFQSELRACRNDLGEVKWKRKEEKERAATRRGQRGERSGCAVQVEGGRQTERERARDRGETRHSLLKHLGTGCVGGEATHTHTGKGEGKGAILMAIQKRLFFCVSSFIVFFCLCNYDGHVREAGGFLLM